MCRQSSRAAATACRGHRGPFFQKRLGTDPRGSAPMKASGRENSISFSCMSSAKAAAALAGAPACLTPRLRPGRPIRATPFLPQHARRPPIFLRWHEHLQLFINSFERHALSRRGFPCLARLYPTLADLVVPPNFQKIAGPLFDGYSARLSCARNAGSRHQILKLVCQPTIAQAARPLQF